VVVNGNKAYVFYFTHPGKTKLLPAPPNTAAARRSVIQVAELEWRDGEIVCDRNKPTFIHLQPKQ
jgi:hypothetical protein